MRVFCYALQALKYLFEAVIWEALSDFGFSVDGSLKIL